MDTQSQKLNSQRLNSKIFDWLYDFLLLGFCLGQLPRFLFEYHTTTKYKEDLLQRFGLYSPAVLRQFQQGKSAWIHAVSVGEVVAATPLVKELSVRHTDLPLTISTVTRTGREMVKKSLGPKNQSIFLPFDFRWITERAMSLIHPRFLLLTETEVWPNLLQSATRRAIPVMIINGRISSRSYERYRLVRSLLRPILARIRIFGMQSSRDAARIIQLGADPKRVFVTGNLKFDQANTRISRADQDTLCQGLRLSPQAPVLMAGSTHRGEEEIIIEIYRHLLTHFPDLVLLIAPRYLPEIPAIEAKCSQEGLFSERKTHLWKGDSRKPGNGRSDGESRSKPADSQSDGESLKPADAGRRADGQKDGESLKPADASKRADGQIGRVIILDTIGELSRMYSLATVVFVGGSLVPIGGHNLLEPAMYGKPILFGSHVDNFREISQLLKNCGAGFEAKSKEELKGYLEGLLQDQMRRDAAGRAAVQVVEENRGATQKTVELIERYMM
jgi:3-deoxy-D-manno-octulosonic-acid transferase